VLGLSSIATAREKDSGLLIPGFRVVFVFILKFLFLSLFFNPITLFYLLYLLSLYVHIFLGAPMRPPKYAFWSFRECLQEKKRLRCLLLFEEIGSRRIYVSLFAGSGGWRGGFDEGAA